MGAALDGADYHKAALGVRQLMFLEKFGDEVAAAFDRRTYGQGSETTAVVVVQDGRIVAERYRPDFTRHTSQRTWSVAKSLAGTIVGAAVQDGILRLDAPAPVPEWKRPGDPRAAITTAQLLRMNSGLNSDHPGNRTDLLYFGGMGVADTIAGLPLVARPGTHFRYSNNDIVAADCVGNLNALQATDSPDLVTPAPDLESATLGAETTANDTIIYERGFGVRRLDHPERVSALSVLDIVPTGEHFRRAGTPFAMGYFHWYFLAQACPLPENLIAGDPDALIRNGEFRLRARSSAGGARGRPPTTTVSPCPAGPTQQRPSARATRASARPGPIGSVAIM